MWNAGTRSLHVHQAEERFSSPFLNPHSPFPIPYSLFPISHSAFRIPHSESGIALLIVVSVLTVIGIMGVAFAFSMYLETQASRQFVFANQARYLAEGGIQHAWALLDEDRLGSRVDDETEDWATVTRGSDADVDGDGTRDSRWWPVRAVDGDVTGHYALRITDENSKVNLNTARASPSASGFEQINLTTFLEHAGIRDARKVAEAIEAYRYGPDERPGKARIDDDKDGSIDEADEYQPLALLGDDRRLEGLGELVTIAGLGAEDLQRLSGFATVYSWDLNASVTGKRRVNVNTATAVELVPVLLEAGVRDPWQAAANMADYVDADVEMSRVTKSSQTVTIANQGPLGDWTWTADPEGRYESETPSGTALTWALAVPSGTFHLRARGLAGIPVGDVTVEGRLIPSVDDGGSLGIFTLSGSLVVQVAHHGGAGTSCAFRGIELVSEEAETGTVIRGIEAVRVNELMVEPTMEFDVSSAAFEAQGSGWVCAGGTCSNAGVGQARWTWTSPLVLPGRYYVNVYGASAGQTVGEVRIEGATKLLVHEQRHPSTLLVGSDGKISLTIGKTNAEQTYFLRKVAVSVQPDGEYLELINLSDSAVNVGGWSIEGELGGGRQARLPSGSVITAHGLLVAAVDLNDSQANLGGNGIDARSAWEISDEVNAVQLEFPTGAPSPDDDWLKASGVSGSARLALKSGTVTVDEVEYPPQTSPRFQSLEKGDPTVIVDWDQDGVDEGWYPSLQLYTPGLANDNDGLKELVGTETITHDPHEEITVVNRPLQGVGELAGLASGKAWKPFSTVDLAKIVDLLTVEGYRLETEGHWDGTEGEGAWEETPDGFVHTDPAAADIAGRWQWVGVPDSNYRVSLYSCDGCLGEQLAVRWEQQDGTFTAWSPELFTDAQGRIVIGQVTIGEPASTEGQDGGTPSQTLTLEVKCASPSGICRVNHVLLDPQPIRIGPVNVNTAPREVLLALPGMTESLASRIISGRPYGDQDQKGRGIGDLFLGEVLGTDEEEKLETFRKLAHLLTTRTGVFYIVSLGQATEDEQVRATQRIVTVLQR